MEQHQLIWKHLQSIHTKISELEKGQKLIMASIQDVLADVKAENTLIASVGTLVSGLKQQLQDALAAAGTIDPATQAAIDSVFSQVEANKSQLAISLASNTAAAAPLGVATLPEAGLQAPQAPPNLEGAFQPNPPQ